MLEYIGERAYYLEPRELAELSTTSHSNQSYETKLLRCTFSFIKTECMYACVECVRCLQSDRYRDR